MVTSQFQETGRELFTRGLVSSHTGNLSIRLGDNLIITRRGSQLDSLQEQDLIETGIFKDDRSTPLASTELEVHRAIYRRTSALVIIHAHPPYSVTLSMKGKSIVSGIEGYKTIGDVPVLGWDMEVRPGGLADIISEALSDRRIVMVYTHGTFATGQVFEEALNYTTTFEENCQAICLQKSPEVGDTK